MFLGCVAARSGKDFAFWSEIEEMKSCIYCVETANVGINLSKFWHHLLVLLLEETTSRFGETLQNTIGDESLQ